MQRLGRQQSVSPGTGIFCLPVLVLPLVPGFNLMMSLLCRVLFCRAITKNCMPDRWWQIDWCYGLCGVLPVLLCAFRKALWSNVY